MNKFKSFLSLSLILCLCSNVFAVTSTLQKYGKAENNNIINIDGRDYSVIDDMLILADQKQQKFDVNKAKWTDGKVFYEFASDVTDQNRQRFVDAYQVWESVADLEFIERTDQLNYIYVQNDNRNYAIVGMVGGRQILSMTSWYSQYVIVHEIGHSLGMWHEHMRSDRDDYVTILEENIDPDQKYNFTKRQTSDNSEYDFLSIMHYTLSSYTINGLPTIRPHAEFEEIGQYAGQREFISGGDQVEVAIAYGANPISFADPNFEAFLLANYDLNSDGVLDTLEAAKVTSLTLPGNGNISSLTGIEFFRHLEFLNVSNENLSVLENLPPRIETIIARNNQFELVDFEWRNPPLLNTLDVTGNLFNVYDCDNLIALENAISNGTVSFSPVADGTALICDESTRNMLVNGQAKENLRSKQAQTYFIDIPEGQTQLIIETTRFNDLDGGLMDLFVSFEEEPSLTNYDYSSANPNNDEFVNISNPQSGRWFITLQPTDRSFENVSLTATYSNDPVTAGLLQNGVEQTQLMGSKGGELNFFIDIPGDANDLRIEIAGGTGDADLYVKAGQVPTLSNFDCRPYRNGNNETCTFASPENTRYHITLVGYTEFNGVSLVANYEINQPVPGGSVTRDNVSGAAGTWQYFTLEIPEGMTQLKIAMSGGSGDADLYVSNEDRPSTSRYNCRPYLDGNIESCEFGNPKAGTWFIGVRGYTSFDDVSLQAVWK